MVTSSAEGIENSKEYAEYVRAKIALRFSNNDLKAMEELVYLVNKSRRWARGHRQ